MVNVIRDDAEAIRVAVDLAAAFAADDARRDRQRHIPYDLVDTLSESGLLAITVPPEYGGAGVTARTVGEVFTELAAGDSSLGQIPQNHFFFVNVLAHAGSEEQKRFFYDEVRCGKRFGNALAERGSRDAHDFRIGFTPQPGGGYLLDGTKYYSTGSLFADWIPVYAKDPDGRLHAAWVPSGDPGVLVIDDWNGMGQRTTGSGTVRFSDVHVPSRHVVPAYQIFEKTEVFGAFGQYMHACVDLGIAIAALRDGKRLIRAAARPWWEAGVERAADEPSVIEKFGELALLVRAARAQSDTAAVTVSSDIFALIGSRATSDELNLNRHWRNARTHTLHDPRRPAASQRHHLTRKAMPCPASMPNGSPGRARSPSSWRPTPPSATGPMPSRPPRPSCSRARACPRC